MSIWAEIWAYNQEAQNSGERFVLVAVAHFCDRKGEGWPGQRSIAEMTMQTQRTVRRHLVSWEKRGVLTRRARYRKDGSRTSDLYRLNAPFEMLGPPDAKPRDKLTPPADKLTAGQGPGPDGGAGVGVRTTASDRPGSDLPLNGNGSAIEGREAGHMPKRALSRRATEIPDNFEPEGDAVELLKELGLNIQDEIVNFIDKHREKGARYVDWQARFRGWIRKSLAFPARSASSKPKDPVGGSDASANAIARKCTHGGCPPHLCRLSKEGFEAQDLENAGGVAARLMNEIVR
jgi:hypothetical protein